MKKPDKLSVAKHKSSLPAISKLDSDGDDGPSAGSDEDLDMADGTKEGRLFGLLSGE